MSEEFKNPDDGPEQEIPSDAADGEARGAEVLSPSPGTQQPPEIPETASPRLERLQKILAQAGVASRRHAEELITQGRVQVNGQTVTTLGSKADPTHDHIRVDGKLLAGAERQRYFMLNKPKGYVTTVTDPLGRPTVMDFFARTGERLYPVGRLDYQSEGLLLITNDGDLAHRLTRAASGVEKTYLVKVSGQPSPAALDRLRSGIAIEKGEPGGGKVRTAPARIEQARLGANPWYEVVLIEGRNRELRKMFEEIGHPVEKIRRVGYGPLVLDVEPGKMRALDAEEIRALRLTAEGKFKPRRPKFRQMLPKEAGPSAESPGRSAPRRSVEKPRFTRHDETRGKADRPFGGRREAPGENRVPGIRRERSDERGSRPLRGFARGESRVGDRGPGAPDTGREKVRVTPGRSGSWRPPAAPGRDRGARPEVQFDKRRGPGSGRTERPFGRAKGTGKPPFAAGSRPPAAPGRDRGARPEVQFEKRPGPGSGRTERPFGRAKASGRPPFVASSRPPGAPGREGGTRPRVEFEKRRGSGPARTERPFGRAKGTGKPPFAAGSRPTAAPGRDRGARPEAAFDKRRGSGPARTQRPFGRAKGTGKPPFAAGTRPPAAPGGEGGTRPRVEFDKRRGSGSGRTERPFGRSKAAGKPPFAGGRQGEGAPAKGPRRGSRPPAKRRSGPGSRDK